ncbi:hypothetical protein LY90DRAFT_667338 [Neocallimastix californiae]|uniref:EF-hand domain-containing protein n=1 Tax=Neocallimastix californiae TaxID=1754190 RepID=A0A1Y2EIS5_9FUNG|nr:hypothetical protein LY90DRAFT_667338 [Neocallimastix californiae]|eukprot:ORY70695.1 hypothetical protein LY90DRAFT_667338 [Neocallimastix californiae]
MELFGAKKINKNTLLSIELLDDKKKKLTKECEDLLIEIFKNFDFDKDGFWNHLEINSYFKTTNGSRLSKDAFNEILESFDTNDRQELTIKVSLICTIFKL